MMKYMKHIHCCIAFAVFHSYAFEAINHRRITVVRSHAFEAMQVHHSHLRCIEPFPFALWSILMKLLMPLLQRYLNLMFTQTMI